MRTKLIFALLLLVLVACKKKNDSSSPDAAPATAGLLVPASNSTCTTGTVVSATISTVTFNWSGAANAESYELTVENLFDNTKNIQTTTNTQLAVNLNRNTPYAWWVVSKSGRSATTSKSDVFRFYNSGIATSSYAPFPADLTAPAFGQTVTATGGKVTLTWSGADVDNDIVAYDVYAGTNAASLPVVQAEQVSASYNLNVISGNTYYWKIVTKDSKANTSVSGVGQFKVN